jgi:nicotinamidase-related amidase
MTIDQKQGLAAWHDVVRLPEFPVVPAQTALVVIDLTYQQASRDHGICKRIRDDGFGDDLAYYLNRMEETVLPNVVRLADGFRRAGSPVIYTRCVSLRGDGSDQTWRHRSFGLVCSVDSEDARILDEVAPQEGDILLNKTGSSVFNSTNFEHLLRNMGITTLVVSGIFTNSCVEGTTRDAGDLDFRVLIAEDSCAAMSPSGHQNALAYLDANFCHVKSTEEILTLMGAPVAQAIR